MGLQYLAASISDCHIPKTKQSKNPKDVLSNFILSLILVSKHAFPYKNQYFPNSIPSIYK